MQRLSDPKSFDLISRELLYHIKIISQEGRMLKSMRLLLFKEEIMRTFYISFTDVTGRVHQGLYYASEENIETLEASNAGIDLV